MRQALRVFAASRLLWSSVALSAAAVVVLSRWLTPSPTGVGTHVALGLPPCGFLAWSGLPCPSCGLTTSFSHLAHGELSLALQAHPVGLPLFVVALVAPPLALYYASRGESVRHAIEDFQADRVALFLVLTLMLTWAAKLVAVSMH